MKIHSVFHIVLLESYKQLEIPERMQALSSSIVIKNKIEYEIEDILNS